MVREHGVDLPAAAGEVEMRVAAVGGDSEAISADGDQGAAGAGEQVDEIACRGRWFRVGEGAEFEARAASGD